MPTVRTRCCRYGKGKLSLIRRPRKETHRPFLCRHPYRLDISVATVHHIPASHRLLPWNVQTSYCNHYNTRSSSLSLVRIPLHKSNTLGTLRFAGHSRGGLDNISAQTESQTYQPRRLLHSHFMTANSPDSQTLYGAEFKPPKFERVVVLDKLTRWEVLCEQAKTDAEIEFMKKEFPGMFETYRTHLAAIQFAIESLQKQNVQLNVVKAQRNKPVSLRDVDAIISAGGDGTFLEAASLVNLTSVPIWVFGINTDPFRSEGRLLLQTPCTTKVEHFLSQDSLVPPTAQAVDRGGECPLLKAPRERSLIPSTKTHQTDANVMCIAHAINKILTGTFHPIRRRRIRVTITDPLHTESVSGSLGSLSREVAITRRKDDSQSVGSQLSPIRGARSVVKSKLVGRSAPSLIHRSQEEPQEDNDEEEQEEREEKKHASQRSSEGSISVPNRLGLSDFESADVKGRKRHIIDYRAVNDVFVTSRASHETMYVEMIVDGGQPLRSKNSGVLVCTGSGSSAWAYNASKVSPETVQKVIDAFIDQQPEAVKQQMRMPSVESLCSKVNLSLLFDPEEPKMRFVVKDPIDNRVFSTPTVAGFCSRISLRPLNADVCLSLDGLSVMSVKFGQEVLLEIQYLEDALLTGN